MADSFYLLCRDAPLADSKVGLSPLEARLSQPASAALHRAQAIVDELPVVELNAVRRPILDSLPQLLEFRAV